MIGSLNFFSKIIVKNWKNFFPKIFYLSQYIFLNAENNDYMFCNKKRKNKKITQAEPNFKNEYFISKDN